MTQTDFSPHEIAKEIAPIGEGAMSLDEYKKLYAESIADPSAFWSAEAENRLDWFSPFTQGLSGDFHAGDVTWFAGGKLNVCYNAIDRHVQNGKANQVAMVFEGDEPTDIRKITYLELQRKVSQIANALKMSGVRKGDVVTVYLPMIPELAMTMLACARIGALHSVVFAGFSAEALGQRISAAASKFLVTADQGRRGGKSIPLKEIANAAREKLDCEELLEKVLVFERFYDPEGDVPYESMPKDVRMDSLVADQRPCCPPETMDSEDGLFLLYTSGSTGKPKGLMHTSAGYALYAAFTTEKTFDLKDGDLFACVADCGWITGHTYVVYGPLLNGSTTFLFESTPVYPDPGRYWDMIQRHKITQFYTAPTAIRLLMRYGDDYPTKYDTSSVRVLGSVGEPINPEAFRWYIEIVCNEQHDRNMRTRSAILLIYLYRTYLPVGVDNRALVFADNFNIPTKGFRVLMFLSCCSLQTETGGHVVTNFPGITPMKPGSCTLPSYGIDTVVLDPFTGTPVTEADEKGHYEGVLAIRQPWPGIARTCINAHERYLKTYLHVYKGYYFTGDSVILDQDGYHWIVGRVDDVLNVSGHRIGTAEVESALVAHGAVAQAAVVGQPHEIKGQSIAAFVMLIEGQSESEALVKELKNLVRKEIGGFASPDMVLVTPSLPMTRSGKIMRRILRKIVSHEEDTLGDTSTLADPSIVDVLIEKFASFNK